MIKTTNLRIENCTQLGAVGDIHEPLEIQEINRTNNTIRRDSKSQMRSGNFLKSMILFCVLFCISFTTYGQVTELSWEKLRILANNGEDFPQYLVGMIYKDGSEEFFKREPEFKLDSKISKNTEKAIFWLTKAAEQGYLEGQKELADCYLNEETFTQFVYWCQKAAKQGDAFSQYRIAHCYKKGLEVKEDGNMALYWYEKSIEKREEDNLSQTLKEEVEFLIEILKEQGYSSSKAEK